MNKFYTFDENDIKAILAKKYNVTPSNVECEINIYKADRPYETDSKSVTFTVRIGAGADVDEEF